MVSVEEWEVGILRLAHSAYPYGELTPRAYTAVLDMLSGAIPARHHRELRPRLVWDRVNNRLARCRVKTAGADQRRHHLRPRRVQRHLADSKIKLGELDEEFVYEARRRHAAARLAGVASSS